MIWPVWVSGHDDTDYMQSEPFLVNFGSFNIHIMKLEGSKGLVVTGQSRRALIIANLSPPLSTLTRYQGRFGPKSIVFGHKMRGYGRAPPDLARPTAGTTGEFVAQNVDLARPQPREYDG